MLLHSDVEQFSLLMEITQDPAIADLVDRNQVDRLGNTTFCCDTQIVITAMKI